MTMAMVTAAMAVATATMAETAVVTATEETD